MKIAVYTIAKNEEQFVKTWAESAKDADYRIILDTGSSDNTVKLAKSLGIKVESFVISPWRFDEARNLSLSFVPEDADICIALDMDEQLQPGWREKLEGIHPKTTRPRYKYTWSWKEDGTPGLEYGGDKIHKRHGYFWKHPVHEVLVTNEEEIQEWIDLEIHHHPDPTKSRGQYLPLLELSVKEDPDDDRNAFYYARELFFYGQLEKAAQEFKRHLSLPRAVWKPERAASMRYLAKCEPENAIKHLHDAVNESPNRRESLVELALEYYKIQNWINCYSFAIQAIAIQEKPLDYLCEEFAWGELPYDLAAISAFYMGITAKAIEFGTKAVELNPNDERLKNNLIFYKK